MSSVSWIKNRDTASRPGPFLPPGGAHGGFGYHPAGAEKGVIPVPRLGEPMAPSKLPLTNQACLRILPPRKNRRQSYDSIAASFGISVPDQTFTHQVSGFTDQVSSFSDQAARLCGSKIQYVVSRNVVMHLCTVDRGDAGVVCISSIPGTGGNDEDKESKGFLGRVDVHRLWPVFHDRRPQL